MSNRVMSETRVAGQPVVRGREPILVSLLVLDLLLFAGGAVAHLGIPIPLGFDTWYETYLVPAAIVEGVGALALLVLLVSLGAGTKWSTRVAWLALWYCFAAPLWGLFRLALGSVPEARTVSNDFLHIGMILVTTLALVRLASLRE